MTRVALPGLRPLALALTVVLVGCTTTRDCSLVDMSSHVSVDLPSEEWEISEFCLDDECVVDVRPADHTGGEHVVSMSVGDDPDDYQYTLAVVSPEGEVHEIEGVLSTERYYPDGPGCSPKIALATLVVDENAQATIDHLS